MHIYNIRSHEVAMGKLDSRTLSKLPTGTHADGNGLIFRVLPSGRQAFYFQYAQGPKRRKMAIKGGEYPRMTLSKARDEAVRLKAVVSEGKDPQVSKVGLPTVAVAIDEYNEALKTKLQTRGRKNGLPYSKTYLYETARQLVTLSDSVGYMNIAKVQDHHIETICRAFTSKGKHGAAALFYRTASAFFTWNRKQTGDRRLAANPCFGLEAPAPPAAREKDWRNDEVRRILVSLDARPASHIIRILFWTGCRLSEARLMEKTELDLHKGIWTLPAERTKGRRKHVVPLPRQAVEYLEEITKDMSDTDTFVFTASPRKEPFNGMNKAKKRLDEKSGVDWILHDTRRFVSTRARELGAAQSTVSALLSHVRQDVTGKHYDSYDERTEREIALQKVADDLDRITGSTPDTSSVVTLKTG